MGVIEFLLLQLIAHILADFYFQTDKLAAKKNELGFKSRFLVWHTLILFALSWLLSFQLKFFVGAAFIAITHYFIDGFKPRINRHSYWGKYAFFVDQLLHLAMLVIAVFVFEKFHSLQFYWSPLDVKVIAIILAYLCCIKPANIIIKEVFRTSQIDIKQSTATPLEIPASGNELPSTGKLIGILERILALTFILIGQFQAVGFLIAAKSVLRYKDTETLKTEYVLIGTMLSFGIAVVLGILANAF